jgi:hypothetical protein
MQYASQALERLLRKEFIDPNLGTSEEHERVAMVLDKFLTELSDFQYRQGVFTKAHIWIIAEEDEQYLAHIWHKKYSVPETKYLGRFACKKL